MPHVAHIVMCLLFDFALECRISILIEQLDFTVLFCVEIQSVNQVSWVVLLLSLCTLLLALLGDSTLRVLWELLRLSKSYTVLEILYITWSMAYVIGYKKHLCLHVT